MKFLNLYLGTKTKSGKIFSILKLTKKGWKTNLESLDELCIVDLTPESLRDTFVKFVRNYLFPNGNAYMYLLEDATKIHVTGIISHLSSVPTPSGIREVDSETSFHIKGIEKKHPEKVVTYNKETNSMYLSGLSAPEIPVSVEFTLSWVFYLASQGYSIPTAPLTRDSLLQPFEVAPNKTK